MAENKVGETAIHPKCLVFQVISHLTKKTGLMYIYIYNARTLPAFSLMKLEC